MHSFAYMALFCFVAAYDVYIQWFIFTYGFSYFSVFFFDNLCPLSFALYHVNVTLSSLQFDSSRQFLLLQLASAFQYPSITLPTTQ